MCVRAEWPSKLELWGVFSYYRVDFKGKEHCRAWPGSIRIRHWNFWLNACMRMWMRTPLNGSLCASVLCSACFGAIVVIYWAALWCARGLPWWEGRRTRKEGRGRAAEEGEGEGERSCLPSRRGAESGLQLTQVDSKWKWMNTNDHRDKDAGLSGGGRQADQGRSRNSPRLCWP